MWLQVAPLSFIFITVCVICAHAVWGSPLCDHWHLCHRVSHIFSLARDALAYASVYSHSYRPSFPSQLFAHTANGSNNNFNNILVTSMLGQKVSCDEKSPFLTMLTTVEVCFHMRFEESCSWSDSCSKIKSFDVSFNRKITIFICEFKSNILQVE